MLRPQYLIEINIQREKIEKCIFWQGVSTTKKTSGNIHLGE
jgi:hypothetical protein